MSFKRGDKRKIKFCKSHCVTPMAHVELYEYDDGTLELWHYGSNILNIDSCNILHLGNRYDYGTLTKQLCREFCRQYGVDDQYDELTYGAGIKLVSEVK